MLALLKPLMLENLLLLEKLSDFRERKSYLYSWLEGRAVSAEPERLLINFNITHPTKKAVMDSKTGLKINHQGAVVPSAA